MSGHPHSPGACFSGLDEVHVSTIHLAAKMLELTTDWSIGVPQGIIQPYKWKATEVIKPRDSCSREEEKDLNTDSKPSAEKVLSWHGYSFSRHSLKM